MAKQESSDMAKRSFLTVTDMFCGAGGSSLGVTAAGAELCIAMNHWKRKNKKGDCHFDE
jgi:DNA (cytosine-5)-methyltransferase 1